MRWFPAVLCAGVVLLAAWESNRHCLGASSPPPVLTLLGPNPLANECHTALSDPGAKATGSPAAISGGGFHSLALKRDATVAAWGQTNSGQTAVPGSLSNVVDISGGGLHTLARLQDGTVIAWGDNFYGQSTVPADLSNAVAIAAGGFHSLALRRDGTVIAWGWDDFGQTAVPASLNDVVAIAAGAWHSLALKRDGTVVAWGYNDDGETNVPAVLNNVTAIAAGGWHSLALTRDSKVVAWGWNADGQTNVPAGSSNVTAIAGGLYHSLLLQSDGTVSAWGDNTYHQTNVPAGLSGVLAIAGGGEHNLALRRDGQVVAWGRNDDGQANVPGNLTADLTSRITVHGTVNTNQPGTYALTYVVTDPFGQTAATNRTIVVVDTVPPEITCADMVVNTDASSCSSNVVFNLMATDRCGTPHVVCDPASGSAFGRGTTTVSCTAIDDSGNSNRCSFRVTVIDATPPRFSCPDIAVEFASTNGASVIFAPTAADACDGPEPVTCVPISGSTFAIGTTTVRCTATDASGNAGACGFQVTVLGALGKKQNVLAELIALRAAVARPHDRDELDEAVNHLTKALDPALWIDQTHVDSKHGEKVFEEEAATARELCEMIKDKKSSVPPAVLQAFIDRLAQADRLLAVIKIQEAAAAGATPKKIAEDLKELAKGDEEAGHCDAGIEHYRNAWKHAAHLGVKVAQAVKATLRLEFLASLPGQTYAIQASTNLLDWVTVSTVQAGEDGTVVFEDPNVGQFAARFYRAVVTP